MDDGDGHDRSTQSRRKVLLALSCGVGGLAGCSSLGSSDETTEGGGETESAETETPSQETPTPGQETPTDETPTDDGGSDADVRIGMLQPLSGPLETYGKIAVRGFYTYFGYRLDESVMPAEISEGVTSFDVDDVTYTVDLRDTEGSAAQAETQAQDVISEVDVLAGTTNSDAALRVAKTFSEPFIAGPAASTALTDDSENCSERLFRASESVAMDAMAGGQYVGLQTDIDSVYIYYADTSFGRSVKSNYERVLANSGVTVAGSQALPQQYRENWPSQLQQAANANVDAAIAGFTVETLPNMIGTYISQGYDFSLVAGLGTRIANGIYGTTIANQLGTDFTAEEIRQSGLGPFTTRYHWNQYDNDVNTEANRLHRSVYGTNADLFTSGLFTTASALVQAVEQSGSTSAGDLVQQLRGMSVTDTMKGENAYQFQEHNNQATSPMTVTDLVPTEDTDYWDARIQPGDPVETYSRERTTRVRELVDCSLD